MTTTTIPAPVPSMFHFPCWELTLHPDEGAKETRYLVWAPGDITHQGIPSGNTRDHWGANWQSHFGGRGGHTSGDSMDSVLSLFPDDVAAAFREVVTEWARPTPERVEILEPGSTPELSDVLIYDGAPSDAWRTLQPGTYHGTGGLNVGTDDEYLEDVTLVVSETSSTATWGIA